MKALESGARECVRNDTGVCKASPRVIETLELKESHAGKLPAQALQYLENVQRTSARSAGAAFTLGNLKSVPKRLPSEEAVSLMKKTSSFLQNADSA